MCVEFYAGVPDVYGSGPWLTNSTPPPPPFSQTQTDDALKTETFNNMKKLPDGLYVPSQTELDGSLGHLV